MSPKSNTEIIELAQYLILKRIRKMKIISRNKQKDTQPLAGFFAIKNLLVVPLAVFLLISSTLEMVVPSVI